MSTGRGEKTLAGQGVVLQVHGPKKGMFKIMQAEIVMGHFSNFNSWHWLHNSMRTTKDYVEW